MGVKVSAEANRQLMSYAIGAMWELGDLLGDIKRVRLFIHQPRTKNLSEWDCSIKNLFAFRDNVLAPAAAKAFAMYEERLEIELSPGEKQCRWCKVKASCPAKTRQIMEAVLADFEDLTPQPKRR